MFFYQFLLFCFGTCPIILDSRFPNTIHTHFRMFTNNSIASFNQLGSAMERYVSNVFDSNLGMAAQVLNFELQKWAW